MFRHDCTNSKHQLESLSQATLCTKISLSSSRKYQTDVSFYILFVVVLLAKLRCFKLMSLVSRQKYEISSESIKEMQGKVIAARI